MTWRGIGFLGQDNTHELETIACVPYTVERREMKGKSETAISCLGERERCANKQKGKVTNLKVSAILG